MATATPAPEKLSKGKVLASLIRELEDVQEDKKDSMAAFKKDETRLRNEIRRLAGDINTGQSDLFDVTVEPEPHDIAEKIADAMDGMVIKTPNGTATVKAVKKGNK